MSAAALGKSKALSTAAAPPPPPPPVAAAAAAAVAAASATAAPGRAALFAALTDALAGALGSVVAVAVFYPIDVAKTRAQASSSPSSSGHARDDHEPIDAASRRGSGEGVAGGREAGWLRSRTLSALVSLVRHEGVSRLYEGIEAKALQSLLGSFIYFYAYAFIKGAMRRRFQRGGGGMPAGSSKSLRPSLNLLAAALAGAINQLFTLPLENITTRMQTAQRTPPLSDGDDGGSSPPLREKSPAIRREDAAGLRHSAAGFEHNAAAVEVAGVAGATRTVCSGSRLSVSANNTQETEGKCGGVWSDATAAAADNRRGGGGGGGGGDGGDDDHAAAARGGGGGDGGAGGDGSGGAGGGAGAGGGHGGGGGAGASGSGEGGGARAGGDAGAGAGAGDGGGVAASPVGTFAEGKADGGDKKLSQIAAGRDFGLAGITQPVKTLRGAGNDEGEPVGGEDFLGRDRPNGNIPATSAAVSALCLSGPEVQQQRQRQQLNISGREVPQQGQVRRQQQQQQQQQQRERQRRERKRQSLLTVAAELYREGGGIAGGGIARFWRGFVPSLVLTCNPAINYTAFDLLKALWLRRRAAAEAGAGAATAAASATAGVGASAGGGGGSAPGVVVAAGSESFLNPVEAFLVAAAAKSLATLVTYPLIRAKVVLMTSSRSKHAPSSRSCSCSCASCSCYFSSSPPSSSCSCSSRPCCRFSAGRGGGYSVAATGEEATVELPSASAAARRREGAFKLDGDGDCQLGGDDEDSPTAEHVLDGTNIGIRQQAPERHSVSRGDNSSSPAMCESCVRNSCDAAAAAVVAAVAVAAGAAPAGWEGARGGGGDGDLRGMGTVIVDIFRREGIGGLYAGCGAQLLHTILKSALLLATKEQLARAAASAVLLL